MCYNVLKKVSVIAQVNNIGAVLHVTSYATEPLCNNDSLGILLGVTHVGRRSLLTKFTVFEI